MAGLFNLLGVLAFTKGFQDLSLGSYFPELFSGWGLVGILLWGLAYLAMAHRYTKAPEILLVFAVEKVFYFAAWCWWHWHNFTRLPQIWGENPKAAIFYSVFGPGDLAFAFFFLALYFGAVRSTDERHS